jgi:hypothetical protein
MKKFKYFIIPAIISCSFITVYAMTSSFEFNSSNLSFTSNSKKSTVTDNFNESYKLSYSLTSDDIEFEEEIKQLVKKTTYLILGDFNNTNESTEEYYQRHKEYEDLAAYKYFPKDSNTSSGYDESNPNYKYAVASELAIPQLFNKFNELGIIYNSYGDIRISKNDDLVIASITLPNVKMKEENENQPKDYNYIETDLTIFYYFIKIDDSYKLAYIFGETKDELDDYFNQVEGTETKTTMSIIPSYDSNLKSLYDYTKLENMTEAELNSIYQNNVNNVVVLNSYYNTSIVESANGFFINDGLIVTTWNFIENSLIKAQYISVRGNNDINYEIDGIVTANPETNVAVLKLKNKNGSYVSLGNNEDVKSEDPAITISSKSGVGFTTQTGIVIANDEYIQIAIPLSETDEGSPLFDQNGKVIGINTSKSTNSSISLAVNSNVLKEIQEKFNSIDFESIETITFEKLKEEYYYTKYNEENIVNSIPKSKWETFKKIGDIENTLNLNLVKASYKDGIVSLRYENSISKYIDSMQLAVDFREKLLSDGYEETYSSSQKYIYKNEKYQVVIMEEFDYLIVVMVKL